MSDVRDWKTRLMNALALYRYATVDMNAQPGPQMVSPQQLIEVVSKSYEGVPEAWSMAMDHLQALKPLSVDSVAIKAERRAIDIVIGRSVDGELTIEGAQLYKDALEDWLSALNDLLPKLQASDEEKTRINQLSSGVGVAFGPGAAAAATKVITALLEAMHGGSCLTIHTVGTNDATAKQFESTDLTSLPWNGIANRNWLWEATPNVVHGSLESNDVGIYGPDFNNGELTERLQIVDG